MQLKNSIDIFNYWDRIRGQFDAPLRAQIDPASVRHILPQLFILESTKASQLRFRLAGTAICSLFGRELREENFASLWSGSEPVEPVRIAEAVMAKAVPALIHGTGYTFSRRELPFELVMMPIRSADGAYDRLLGCLTPVFPAARLGAEPVECLELDGSRMLTDRAAIPTEHRDEQPGTKTFMVSKGGNLGGAVRKMLQLKIFDGGQAR